MKQPKLRRLNWRLFSITGWWAVFVMASASASEPAPGVARPPATYSLSDVSVLLERQYGHGQPTAVLTLAGVGPSSLQRAGQVRTFAASPQQVADTINALHQVRFFELPARFQGPTSVVVTPDGQVQTKFIRLLDAGGTKLCFKLPTYEKCVAFAGNSPPLLDDLVLRLLGDAEVWSRSASSPR